MKTGDLVFVCYSINANYMPSWEPTEIVRVTQRFFYVRHRYLFNKRIPKGNPKHGSFSVIVPTVEQKAQWAEVQQRQDLLRKLFAQDWSNVSNEDLGKICEILGV